MIVVPVAAVVTVSLRRHTWPSQTPNATPTAAVVLADANAMFVTPLKAIGIW